MFAAKWIGAGREFLESEPGGEFLERGIGKNMANVPT
jgi:hypothetical protein